jgi:hypothetical protein
MRLVVASMAWCPLAVRTPLARCVAGLWTVSLTSVIFCSSVLCSTAMAGAPTGYFAVFSQCPRFTPEVNLCLMSQIAGGELQINNVTIPIGRNITLQGGVIFNEETEAETFVGALNNESLSGPGLSVPGGLTGVLGHAGSPGLSVVSPNLRNVTASIELAGLPQVNTNNLVNERGIAMSLPMRIRLQNPFLGNACYIGTVSRPVVLNLTTGVTSPPGPNRPIKGSVGDLELRDDFELDEASGGALVDNSFAVPVATGCGGSLSSIVDPAIDKRIGLPSASGNNTAITRGTFEDALSANVIASEA